LICGVLHVFPSLPTYRLFSRPVQFCSKVRECSSVLFVF
jgi:hypothetical protein